MMPYQGPAADCDLHQHRRSNFGGERAAAIFALIRSAKLNWLDPKDYLRKVLA
jgi:hypothetical protein